MGLPDSSANVGWKCEEKDYINKRHSVTTKVRFSSPQEFVRKSGGTRVIEKILIANNGIAAVKCMRSIRKWSYATFGNADALRFVCMATPEDIQANAEYIKMANKMVVVPGGSNVNNYANVELILETAVTNEVDAVWAGWGHASENPSLPEALTKQNIAFLGPTHQAMFALGDKIASTILAQSAAVPTLPWSGSNVSIPLKSVNDCSVHSSVIVANASTTSHTTSTSVVSHSSNSDISTRKHGSNVTNTTKHGQLPLRCLNSKNLISDAQYHSCCITSAESCLKCAEAIGYPVMIKAAGGGGGKGIRKAVASSEVAHCFSQVMYELPNSPIFVMKCVSNVRHLEIQVLGDAYGQAISLFGRDCSVQRRHQKIIEEAPIVVAPKEIIEQMEMAAVRLSKLVGYMSAGTVEYLFDPTTNEFYFLELNPRLQVEHPCTEVVADVNLPACQLQIAMGIPLHRIKDIRELYLVSPWTDSVIDLDNSEIRCRPPSCHVIAARITSEDPDQGFKPQPGGVRELNFRSSQCVWGYFSVGSAGGIHQFADSQFGHCFSAAENRDQARENMVLALKELSIRGDFRTTVEYLIKIMESEAFMNHEIDTDWLDIRIAQNDKADKPDLLIGVVCTALHIADNHLKQLFCNYELHLERGQFLPSKSLTNTVDVVLVSDSVKFVLKVVRTGPSSFHLICNDDILNLEVHRMPGEGLLISHEAASYMTYCHEECQSYRTVINNRTMIFLKETDPTVLRSHSPGKLLQYCVADGSHVCANEVYVLIEVMKMVLELRVPTSGKICLKRIPGAILEPGTELACLELDDPSQIKSLQTFSAPFNPFTNLSSTYITQTDMSICENNFNNLHTGNFAKLSAVNGISRSTDNTKVLSSDHLLNCNIDLLTNGSNCTAGGAVTGVTKLHHKFAKLLASFEQILLGYSLDEPFFSSWLNYSLSQLLSLLHDPRLPLLELQETIAHLKDQIPSAMEKALSLQVKLYARQVTSVLARFPSEQILRLIDTHLTHIKSGAGEPIDPNDTAISEFLCATKRLVDLAECYRNGLRGHAIHVISQLLMGYVVVEKHFQHGQYDKCTRQLLAQCQGSTMWGSTSTTGNSIDDDATSEHLALFTLAEHLVPTTFRPLIHPKSISDIVAVIFSHRQLTLKNSLIVGLINLLTERRELTMAYDLQGSLKAITELGASGNAKAALAARQLLIAIQTPSYELRRNQVESIFLSTVDAFGQQFRPGPLNQLITSETVVFDILTDFFYHSNQAVSSAALEVYIRRSYIAYELTSVQHFQLFSGSSFILFKFALPTACNISSPLNRRASNFYGSDASKSAVSKTNCSSHKQLLSKSPLSNGILTDDGNLLSTYSRKNSSRSSIEVINHTQVNSKPTSTGVDTFTSSVERIGGMTAFNTLEELDKSFDELLTLFSSVCADARTLHTSLSEPTFDFDRELCDNKDDDATDNAKMKCNFRERSIVTFQDPPYHTVNPSEDPIHVLNIALRYSNDWSPTNNSMDEASSLFSLQNQFNERRKYSKSGYPFPILSEANDVSQLESFCRKHAVHLHVAGIRRITFLIIKAREFPKCYTFRAKDSYREDRVYRHLEPALAFQLELNRMKAYQLEYVPTINRRMHLYLAHSEVPGQSGVIDYRFFVRCIIRHADLLSRDASFEYLQSEAEHTLLEAMDSLDLAHTHPHAQNTMGNHIFLNFLPVLILEDINRLTSTIRRTAIRYAGRFLRLRVSQAELKFHIRFHSSEPVTAIRVMLCDKHGYDLGLDVYREVFDSCSNKVILQSLDTPMGYFHGKPASNIHKNKDYLELKRFQARKFNTSYVYDYPALFTQALNGVWQANRPHQHTFINESENSDGANSSETSIPKQTMPGFIPAKIPDELITCTELTLDANGQLIPCTHIPGTNEIGVVVWQMVLKTPESPSGRTIIVIANDATFKAGSLGPTEDLMFYRASQLARTLCVPRIYLASNTGARIRISEDVKSVFNVAWIDPDHPEKGYKYLYLTPSDYERLKGLGAVNCDLIEEDGESQYKLTDIIGKEYDMSVENLRGSAMIAGETSSAYDDVFTLTIVTNRAIGIGAYLSRLGQRIIQVNNSHIILTGAMALNKLLGREVYSSNSQLGGVHVMANNGVSHLVASDELSALQQAIEWLMYIPTRPNPASILYKPIQIAQCANVKSNSDYKTNSGQLYCPLFDPIDRLVEYTPSKDRPNDDPRWMFTGVMSSHFASSSKQNPPACRNLMEPDNDHWISGFFDWGTWQETLASWAAGVVVGRARLGGIACGVITAETRSVVCRVPADPANLSSEAQVVTQAGQVWYPDSAYKTAQTIEDLSRENLPLFIFANWRGFSGGMKDMYDQVLKFGSMIIDALRRFTQPVFVYLPPNAQLRGGAWVVADPAINPNLMEMYADPVSCRAGVLEPEGTVEIKFKETDLIKTMHRLDGYCRIMLDELNRLRNPDNIAQSSNTVDQRCHELRIALNNRQVELLPYYQQIANTFADLHDTPGRLKNRGLVHGLVEWSKSRNFFFARLRRRILELTAIKRISQVYPSVSHPYDTVKTNAFHQTEKSFTNDNELTYINQTFSKNGAGIQANTFDGDHTSIINHYEFSDTRPNMDVSLLDYVCQQVPKLATQYSLHISQLLAILKSWFTEAINEMSNAKSTSHISLPTTQLNCENAVTINNNNNYINEEGIAGEIWSDNDLAVGDWLAHQLDCNQLKLVITINYLQECLSNYQELLSLSFTAVTFPEDKRHKIAQQNELIRHCLNKMIISEKITLMKRRSLSDIIAHSFRAIPNPTDTLAEIIQDVLSASERAKLIALLSSRCSNLSNEKNV